MNPERKISGIDLQHRETWTPDNAGEIASHFERDPNDPEFREAFNSFLEVVPDAAVEDFFEQMFKRRLKGSTPK